MRGNIIVNYVSRLFAAVSTFLFVPAYVAVLGPDGYSVIALSVLIVSLVAVLEIGLTPAIGREMARQDVTDNQRRRSFVAIERLFMAFFLLTSIISLLLSDALVRNVFTESAIDKNILANSVSLIGIEAGLQLLFRFHISVLIGLERQIKAALFSILWALLRNGLVVGVIVLYPDLYAFFGWQLVATVFLVLAMKLHSQGIIRDWPRTPGLFFDIETLKRLRRFAGGMLLISLVALANTQLDRLLVGAMASLRDLGAYTLAATLGTSMLIAASPIMTAVQPRLTSYFTRGQRREAIGLFCKSSRIVALIVSPPVVMIATHPEAVLEAWIGKSEMMQIASRIVPFMVAANAFIALSTIGYAAALANGHTRFSNIVGLSSLLLSIPGYYLAMEHFGTVGVAAVYLILQVLSTLVFSRLAMNRFLGGGFVFHHVVNYAVPITGALLGAWLFSFMLGPQPEGRLAILMWLSSGLVVVGLSGTGLAMTVWKLIDRWRSSL